MRLAFQIDKIASLKTKTDTSLLIMNAALRRGFEVWFYYPDSLSCKNGGVYASCFKFDGKPVESSSGLIQDLDDFNFVFLRQDPPFNMNYITTTYFLEMLKKAKVLNNPASVRGAPEKLFVMQFASFMPETLITNSEDEITHFWKKHGEIVLKPIYSHGGAGVFYIPKNDKNLFNTIKILKENYNNIPIIAQKYIKNVVKGDKRILFINGELAGALNRVPKEDRIISNTAAGGSYEETKLTPRELELCALLKPHFKTMGLFLVGIDVIDNLITEINVTSPTGFCLLNSLKNIRIEETIIDEMLKL